MENNIGKLNAIFLQNINNLLKRKDGRKLVKEYSSLFTKNKNLLKEYMVFDYIENVKNTENLKAYITESVSYLDGINKNTLKSLNDKVLNFMIENKIEQIDEIKNEKLYETIESLIFTNKSIKTINERIDKLNNLINYIKENKESIEETENDEFIISENIDAILMIAVNNFNKKYEEQLNEEEKNLFKSITSAESEDDKKLMFEENRKGCLTLTNDFLKESIDNITKEKLLNVKESLLEQKYNNETYIEDILSFIELKKTLSE